MSLGGSLLSKDFQCTLTCICFEYIAYFLTSKLSKQKSPTKSQSHIDVSVITVNSLSCIWIYKVDQLVQDSDDRGHCVLYAVGCQRTLFQSPILFLCLILCRGPFYHGSSSKLPEVEELFSCSKLKLDRDIRYCRIMLLTWLNQSPKATNPIG